MVKEGIYHNTTLPNSSITNFLPVSSSVITPMSPVVCTYVSLGAYTPISSCVSAPVLSSLNLCICLCMCLLVCHHLILLLWGVDHLILSIIFLFNSLIPLLLSLKFIMGQIGNLLVYQILAIHVISSQFSNVFLQQTITLLFSMPTQHHHLSKF